jgi:hypothetical protein
MKFFLDTEFIEDGVTIDLISIGIVSEDGREYYAVNKECDFRRASQWVLENVLEPIGLGQGGFCCVNLSDPSTSPRTKETVLASRSREQIVHEVIAFLCPNSSSLLSGIPLATTVEEELKSVEIYAAWGAYDWVVFCQLWGQMMDLPNGMPFYYNDVISLAKFVGLSRADLPSSPASEHHPLADARWVKEVYFLICQFLKENKDPSEGK